MIHVSGKAFRVGWFLCLFYWTLRSTSRWCGDYWEVSIILNFKYWKFLINHVLMATTTANIYESISNNNRYLAMPTHPRAHTHTKTHPHTHIRTKVRRCTCFYFFRTVQSCTWFVVILNNARHCCITSSWKFEEMSRVGNDSRIFFSSWKFIYTMKSICQYILENICNDRMNLWQRDKGYVKEEDNSLK